MASSENYANDYETTLNGAITTTVRPVNFTLTDPIPSSLSGGAFRVRCDNEYLFVPAGGVAGQVCNGATTVEGSVAATHANGAKVDQVLTRQGLLNNPGPMTTKGDLVYLDASLNPARLPLDADATKIMGQASGLPAWVAAPSGGGGGSSTPLLNPYTARMYRNAALTLTGGSAWTKLPFDTVDDDGDSDITIGSSRYVARVAGWYQVNASLDLTALLAAQIEIAVYVNGTIRASLLDMATGSEGIAGSARVKLNVGDYAELFYLTAGTPALNVGAASRNWMDVTLIPGTPALPANTMSARMYRTAALTLAASAWTKMPFDTSDWDPNSNLTIGSSRYTAPVAGKYLVCAGLTLSAHETTQALIAIYVNGAERVLLTNIESGFGLFGTEVVNLAAGDYVEIWYFSPAIALNVGSPSHNNFADITFLAGTGATIWVPQGPVIIPGFAGSADIQAGGASDDEFETTAASTPTGWTAMTQAPTAVDANTTAKSHLYLKSTTGTDTLRGIYKAAPATPYTLIAKLAEHTLQAGSSHVGIVVADAAPPVKALALQLVAFQAANTSTTPANISATVASYTSIGAAPSTGGAGIATRQVGWLGGPLYLKIVVHTVSNIDFFVSYNGKLWIPLLVGYANGVGLANAGQVGLYVDYNAGGIGSAEALFDFIRFS